MRKISKRLLILDGYTVELLQDGRLSFINSFHTFYEEMAKYFTAVHVAIPHRDTAKGAKYNRVESKGVKYHLLPYFADPIDFFRRILVDLLPTARGIWHAVGECDTCLLRFPSPVLPIIYLIALVRRKRVVLFVMGSWLDTAKNLPPSLKNDIKRIAIYLFELLHRWLVTRHQTISTHPYLDLGLKNVQFGFINTVPGAILESFERKETRDCCGPHNLLFVGRLTEAKGVFVLLEATKLLLLDGKAVHITIVGDGYMREEIRSFVAEFGLAERVTLRGHLKGEALEAAFRAADIFVLPSVTEGVPKVVLEAMSYGLPVVSTKVGALPLLFQDGVHCKFFSIGDASGLADSVTFLIHHPDEATKMSSNARAVCAENSFVITCRKVAAKIGEAYD